MGSFTQVLQICILAGLLSSAQAKHSRWERVLQTGAARSAAQAPAAKLLPPQVQKPIHGIHIVHADDIYASVPTISSHVCLSWPGQA